MDSHIVEYSESIAFTPAVFPDYPSKVVKKLDIPIFDFLFARPQDTDLLFVDIGPRALKFTKDVDLQINTKTREKLEQTFEFMKM